MLPLPKLAGLPALSMLKLAMNLLMQQVWSYLYPATIME